MEAKRKAAIYCRVQEGLPDRETVIESQRIRAEAFCAEKGMEVVGTFHDFASANGNRPGFDSMMEAIESGAANAVVVMNVSRIARDAARLIETIQRISGCGAKLYEIQNGWEIEIPTSLMCDIHK